jgi:hypothetical protein
VRKEVIAQKKKAQSAIVGVDYYFPLEFFHLIGCKLISSPMKKGMNCHSPDVLL